MTHVIAALFFVSANILAFGQSGKINAALAKTIDSLKTVDQSPLKIKNPDSAQFEFRRLTRLNFPMIKSIKEKFGFPGYDLVGKESSNNYWLLVQHSDFDVEFQKEILKLMKVEVDKKNASGQNYAYLIDRIELNEGRPQIYGTQVNMGERGTKIKPCIDTLNIDRRRASVGLPTIKEYLMRCDEVFKEMNKGRGK